MSEPITFGASDIDQAKGNAGANPPANASPAAPSNPSSTDSANQPTNFDISDIDNFAPQSKPQAPSSQKPGFTERAYQTSGAKGIVNLISAEASHRAELLHKAQDAYRNGDRLTATKYAMAAYEGLDKDSPIAQAAKQLVTGPIQEITESWKHTADAGKDAFRGDWGTALSEALVAAQHGIGAVPLVGAGSRAAGETIDQDIQDKNWSGLAGDAFGVLVPFGLGKVAGRMGEAMENTKGASILPAEGDIGGVKVPVSAPQMNDAVLPNSIPGRMTRAAGTASGAQKFIDEEVQPKAVGATTQNMAESAMQTVDEMRKLRNQGPISSKGQAGAGTTNTPPVVNSVNDIVQMLEGEAKPTYQALDKAVEPEIKQWEADKKAWEQNNPEPQNPKPISPTTSQPPTPAQKAVWKAQKDAWKDAKEQWAEDNPRPKAFTELQDQIKHAYNVIDSEASSQVDKEAAIRNLPEYEKEMGDYVNKYGNAVHPDELDVANKLWRQSLQYDWVSKKLRIATRGTTGTSSMLKQKPMQLNPGSLEAMPGSFDNRFGDGAFAKLLGPDGMSNYNDVLNALRNPVTKGMTLEQYLTNHVLAGFGKAVTAPISWTIDQLLFNPKVGQAVLKGWRAAGTATKTAGAATAAGSVAGRTVDRDANQRKIMDGASGLR